MSAEIPHDNTESSIERQKEVLATIQSSHSEALKVVPGLLDRLTADIRERHGYWKVGREATLTVLRAPYDRDDGQPDAEYIQISVQEDTSEGHKSAVALVGDVYTDTGGVMIVRAPNFTREDANLVTICIQELSIARMTTLPDLAENYGSIARKET